MKSCQVHIQGMHCRSCEILIEDELMKVPGVKEVKVSHQTGVAEISYKHDVDKEAINEAVKNAGYTIGTDNKLPIFSRNTNDYFELGFAFFIVVALFLVAKMLGIFDLTKSVSGNYSNLSVVFLIGLTAGVSTCMALVGGLILGAAARFSIKHPRATGIEKFKPHLFFNLGRIASYFVLGGVIGLMGSIFQLSTSVLGTLTVIVGLVMLLLGGQLIEVFPILKKISFTLPKNLHKILGIKDKSEAEYSHKNSVIMGALTFFLPCGFTQAMQLYAMSTGNPISGALTMGVFALGTAPGLLGVGGLTSVIKGSGIRLFFKTAGVVVIALAFFNLSNGFNLMGINASTFTLNKTTDSTIQDPNVKLVNGVQEVRMTQISSGYTPNKFTIKKGIPVKWIITSKDDRSCASSIVSQKLGIRASLQLGENIFNFTPTETGTINFSCSMGMYTGSFSVVDESSNTLKADPINLVANPTTNPVTGSGATGGCGSNGGGCGCGAKQNITTQNSNTPVTDAVTEGNVQVIKSTYTSLLDISPNRFTVKVNQPVRFEIDAQDDGRGCMGSITLPNLTRKVEVFTKGETTVFEFTPTNIGTYNITCGMGVLRGQILVN